MPLFLVHGDSQDTRVWAAVVHAPTHAIALCRAVHYIQSNHPDKADTWQSIDAERLVTAGPNDYPTSGIIEFRAKWDDEPFEFLTHGDHGLYVNPHLRGV